MYFPIILPSSDVILYPAFKQSSIVLEGKYMKEKKALTETKAQMIFMCSYP
jgi:hypothetical protein